ncbi:DUF6234 family protein [Streptomyces sp. B8F3]|uniref:DUF6234 family protein n=1 Tax=Streptomyces sp. B8F3 TaxID=3153573 RepID=UPI00325E7899
MERTRGPTRGSDIGLGVCLLLIDLMVIAWLLYGYGITGWADNYSPDSQAEAPQLAQQFTWLLAGGAVFTGAALIALGSRIAGTVQLVILGGGAMLFAVIAAQ